jgi:putative PIN family toxin of toxin-antitoxin system
VVVDTNVFVSAVINPSGHPARVVAALRDGRFILVTSEPLLDELADVLSRPRIVGRYRLDPAEVAEFHRTLQSEARIVGLTGTVRRCRDPNDDAVIAPALLGNASVLVTRDDDLKGAAEVAAFLEPAGVAVLSVQRFLDLLEE